MFLHVGSDVVVRMRDVVAILDQRAVDAGAATREFLGFMRAQGRVEDVGEGAVKAVVVCTDRVILSPISAGTLKRRVGADSLALG
jgi:hypothetical protein